MDASETEIVRRLLLSALERLEKSNGAGPSRPASAPAMTGPEVAGDGSPIIFLMLGGPRPTLSESAGESARLPAVPDVAQAMPAHPGLEKFAISEHNGFDPAPRTCFMEPGRLCVNSGACEMRGF